MNLSLPRFLSSTSSGSRPSGAAGLPRPGSLRGLDFADVASTERAHGTIENYAARTSTSYSEALRVLCGGGAQLEAVAVDLAARLKVSVPRARGILTGEVVL